MTVREIRTRERCAVQIFKHILKVNERRFENMDITTAVDYIILTCGFITYGEMSRQRIVQQCIEIIEINGFNTGIFY